MDDGNHILIINYKISMKYSKCMIVYVTDKCCRFYEIYILFTVIYKSLELYSPVNTWTGAQSVKFFFFHA